MVVLAQPVNDNCFDETVPLLLLDSSPLPGTLLNSTASIQSEDNYFNVFQVEELLSCSKESLSTVPSIEYPEVYYGVVGTGQGLRVALCFSDKDADALWAAPTLTVYRGDCNSLNCQAVGDLSVGSGLVFLNECNGNRGITIDFGSVQDATYIVRVSVPLVREPIQDFSGNFEISLTQFANAPNDICENALELTNDGTFSVNINSSVATQDVNPICPTSLGYDASAYAPPSGVWYKVRGTGDVMTLFGLCDSPAPDGICTYAVYTGDCKLGLDCVGHNTFLPYKRDDGKECRFDSLQSSISWVSYEDYQYYYINVQAAESGIYDRHIGPHVCWSVPRSRMFPA